MREGARVWGAATSSLIKLRSLDSQEEQLEITAAHYCLFKAIFTGFNPKSSFLRVFVTILTRAPTQNTPLLGLVRNVIFRADLFFIPQKMDGSVMS